MEHPLRLAMRCCSRLYGAVLGCFSDRSAFFDPAQFPWTAHLEENWRDIREELDQLLAERELPALLDVVPHEEIISDRRWKVCVFYGWNIPIVENLKRCPRTAELLRSIPDLTTAMFSIMEPHNYLPPHRGQFRGVIRCHLGLKVPDPPGASRIRVLDEVRTWEEGKPMFLDDTLEHEVWNDSDECRVVLFMDVKRPLPTPLRQLNNAIIWLIGNVLIRPSTRLEKAVTQPGAAAARTHS